MYGLVSSIRNWLFDVGVLNQSKVDIPVICLGNLVVGGSGKTPLAIWLVEKLRKESKRPVVLSRGYGGRLAGPVEVASEHSCRDVGDEPILIGMETGVPVVISRDRVEGAKFIISQGIGDVIVLDDGYQHRYLRRDFNVVCIDITDDERVEEFVQGRSLPFGRFREGREQGLKRADAIVLSYRAFSNSPIMPPAKILPILPKEVPIFCSWLDSLKVVNVRGEALHGGEVYLVTGIANPVGVQESLKRVGYRVANASVFEDHHDFSPEEERDIFRDAGSLPVVCTSKDFVRLSFEASNKMNRIQTTLKLNKEQEFIGMALSAIKNSSL